MKKLVQEFRDLLAKTTQGEWAQANDNPEEGTDVYSVMSGDYVITYDYGVGTEDAEFIVKSHNDLPKLLDELEQVTEDWEREFSINKELYSRNMGLFEELGKYKQALELCKNQRNFIAGEFTRISGDNLALDIINLDKNLDHILKGEVSE